MSLEGGLSRRRCLVGGAAAAGALAALSLPQAARAGAPREGPLIDSGGPARSSAGHNNAPPVPEV